MRKIESMPIDISSVGLDSDLIAEAGDVLGYNPSKVPALGQLAKALNKLDIHPLKPEQVLRYKASKAKKTLTNTAKVAIVLLCVLVSIIAADACFYIVLPNDFVPIASISLAAIVAMWIIFGIWQDGATRRCRITEWNQSSIEDWKKFIPAHVIQKAIEIKKEVPSSDFYVDFLQTRDSVWSSPRALRDPFLYVKNGDDVFYIDVWEEPDFEVKFSYNM